MALAVISAIVATSLFGIPLGVAVALHYHAQEATELERIADIAALDVAADVEHTGHPGRIPAPEVGTVIGLYDPNGTLIGGVGPAGADDAVRQALADNSIQHRSDSGMLVAAVPIPDQAGGLYAVRASMSASEVYPRIGLTWLAMATLGAAIVFVTWRLARWQAKRLARPVEALAASASRLADGDFSVSLASSGIADIDTAADALNHAAERIGDLVERERAVTSHASHQLRTPLAGLRLTLENALHTPGADYHSAVVEALASSDRLQRTIDDLLALARSTDRRTEAPDISALFDEIAGAWRGVLTDSGRNLTTVVDPRLDVPPCSAAAVREILAVLIDNAVRHGVGGVTVHARETVGTVAIDVRDGGSAGATAIDAFSEGSGDDGGRIGLRLARRLADAEGGRVLLTQRTPTTFTFFMPDHAESIGET
ncbi:sensor histidine kinase [Mycolicibacterium arenosum]|uniref:histidine kinase n=1 Tax=Mycolicibacterium arenosum TaxID=2952157 RepID=A0ABT1MBC7_9MYCO|nr:HAMP domain-containing sensor histidine kinase [Mycolicibacterium sp. CAU 1645]MCP9276456.1 HAMP domain-containing histidine kinase [Mycolicibacterium sp. CAU 1645]